MWEYLQESVSEIAEASGNQVVNEAVHRSLLDAGGRSTCLSHVENETLIRLPVDDLARDQEQTLT